MDSKQLLPIILIAVAAGGLGFVGGMQYQKTKAPAFVGFNRNGNGRQGQNGQMLFRGGNANGIQPVRGEIVSVDDKTMTVKAPDGSSKIIVISGSTSINKASEGSTSDLKTGEQVMVIGTTNSDGSVTAQNISLGDFGGRFFQGGVRNSQPGQTQQGPEQRVPSRPAEGQGDNVIFYQQQ